MDNKCSVYIYDRDFNLLNITESAESVIMTRELYSAGDFRISIPHGAKGAAELMRRGNIVIINENRSKSGYIRDFSIEESKKGCICSIYGYTGSGILKKRIAVPPTQAQDLTAFGWDRRKGTAETVLKHYVNNHIVAPADSRRKISAVLIALNRDRGITVNSQLRYARLHDEFRNIASYAGMGYEFYADTLLKKWVFDVIPGTHRGSSQSVNETVVFSIKNGNIAEYRYSENYQNYRNTAYAGGKGENNNRVVLPVNAENTDFDRDEVFLDCGNAELADLLALGNVKLADYGMSDSVEVAVTDGRYVFERDYYLGDTVYVWLEKPRIAKDITVSSVTEVWEKNKGHQVSVRLGGQVANIGSALKSSNSVR